MNLYLLRHGIAAPGNHPGTESDSDRPLTAQGVKRMRKATGGLRRLRVPFDAVPPDSAGTLHWLITPKQLRALGD